MAHISEIVDGVALKSAYRTYYIEKELGNGGTDLRSEQVLYFYFPDSSGRKHYGVTQKSVFRGSGYEAVKPFFEVGKVYRYHGVDTRYTIKSVEEHDGSRVALAWYKSAYDGQINWTYFEQHEFDNELELVKS